MRVLLGAGLLCVALMEALAGDSISFKGNLVGGEYISGTSLTVDSKLKSKVHYI